MESAALWRRGREAWWEGSQAKPYWSHPKTFSPWSPKPSPWRPEISGSRLHPQLQPEEEETTTSAISAGLPHGTGHASPFSCFHVRPATAAQTTVCVLKRHSPDRTPLNAAPPLRAHTRDFVGLLRSVEDTSLPLLDPSRAFLGWITALSLTEDSFWGYWQWWELMQIDDNHRWLHEIHSFIGNCNFLNRRPVLQQNMSCVCVRYEKTPVAIWHWSPFRTEKENLWSNSGIITGA